MDRREIRPESPAEKGRGFMPAISVHPGRLLFTAGLTGRTPDGRLVEGGMGPQTQSTFERLQAIVERAGGQLSQTIKQLMYVTDLDAFASAGRPVRADFIGDMRPASTGVVVRRLADPNMLIEIDLVVDLEQPVQGAF